MTHIQSKLDSIYHRSSHLYWLAFSLSLIWFGGEWARRMDDISLPWSVGRAIALAMFVAVVFLTFRRWFRRHAVTGLLTIGALLVTHSTGIAPLLVVCAFMFSAAMLGGALLGIAKVTGEADAWHRLLALPLGLGVFATVTGLLALLPVNFPALYIVLLATPVILWRGQVMEQLDALGSDIKRLNDHAIGNAWQFIALATIVAVYLLVALLPELGFDALSMHLVVPAQVAEHHQWSFDVERHVWAVMPMNGDWLYTFVYMLGGEYAARLTNLALMLSVAGLLALAVNSWATPRLAILAVMCLLSLPLIYLETTSLFIENAFALFLFPSLICVLLFAERKEGGYLLMAAVLAGVALASKLIAVLFIVPLSLVMLYHLRQARDSVRWIPLLLKCIAILFMLGAIPYVIAWAKTGNPVFPYYNAIFKSPYFETSESFSNPLFRQGFHWLTLRDMTFDSGNFIEGQAGSFGWVFFVLLPVTFLAALLSKVRHAFALVLVSFLYIALTFHSQSYLRYIYPAVPLLILVMMQGMQQLAANQAVLGRTVILAGWLLAGLNVAFLPAASWYYRKLDYRAMLSSSEKDDFLLRSNPIRRAIDFINVSEGAGARVGFFAPGMVAGLKGKAFIVNWHNFKFNSAVFGIQSEAQQPELLRLLKDNGITLIVLQEDFNPGGHLPALAPMLMSLTTLERQFGNVSVRSVRKELRFTEELLKDPDFNGTSNWALSDPAQYQPKEHSVIVSVGKNVSQMVQVAGGAEYQLSATARCVTPGSMFRLQVNWVDKKGAFLGADISPVACSQQYATESRMVRAPTAATAGIVYATGHTSTDLVEYKMLSFR